MQQFFDGSGFVSGSLEINAMWRIKLRCISLESNSYPLEAVQFLGTSSYRHDQFQSHIHGNPLCSRTCASDVPGLSYVYLCDTVIWQCLWKWLLCLLPQMQNRNFLKKERELEGKIGLLEAEVIKERLRNDILQERVVQVWNLWCLIPYSTVHLSIHQSIKSITPLIY